MHEVSLTGCRCVGALVCHIPPVGGKWRISGGRSSPQEKPEIPLEQYIWFTSAFGSPVCSWWEWGALLALASTKKDISAFLFLAGAVLMEGHFCQCGENKNILYFFQMRSFLKMSRFLKIMSTWVLSKYFGISWYSCCDVSQNESLF